jgi:hypothetical protein
MSNNGEPADALVAAYLHDMLEDTRTRDIQGFQWPSVMQRGLQLCYGGGVVGERRALAIVSRVQAETNNASSFPLSTAEQETVLNSHLYAALSTPLAHLPPEAQGKESIELLCHIGVILNTLTHVGITESINPLRTLFLKGYDVADNLSDGKVTITKTMRAYMIGALAEYFGYVPLSSSIAQGLRNIIDLRDPLNEYPLYLSGKKFLIPPEVLEARQNESAQLRSRADASAQVLSAFLSSKQIDHQRMEVGLPIMDSDIPMIHTRLLPDKLGRLMRMGVDGFSRIPWGLTRDRLTADMRRKVVTSLIEVDGTSVLLRATDAVHPTVHDAVLVPEYQTGYDVHAIPELRRLLTASRGIKEKERHAQIFQNAVDLLSDIIVR